MSAHFRMHGLIATIMAFGLDRDVAVNILTELIFLLPFSVLIPTIIVAIRRLDEHKRARTLLPRVYAAADEAVFRFLQMGLHASVLADMSRDRYSSEADTTQNPEKFPSQAIVRTEFLHRAIGNIPVRVRRFDKLFAQVSLGLPIAALKDLWNTSKGLDILELQSVEFASFFEKDGYDKDTAVFDPKYIGVAKTFETQWKEKVGESAKCLRTTYKRLSKRTDKTVEQLPRIPRNKFKSLMKVLCTDPLDIEVLNKLIRSGKTDFGDARNEHRD